MGQNFLERNLHGWAAAPLGSGNTAREPHDNAQSSEVYRCLITATLHEATCNTQLLMLAFGTAWIWHGRCQTIDLTLQGCPLLQGLGNFTAKRPTLFFF